MVNVPKSISKVTIDWQEWEHTLAKVDGMRPIFTDMYGHINSLRKISTNIKTYVGSHPNSMMQNLFAT